MAEKEIKRYIYYKNNIEYITPNIQVALARRDSDTIKIIYTDNSVSNLILHNEEI